MSITKDDGISPPIVTTMNISDWIKISFDDIYGTNIKKISFQTDSDIEFKFYLGVFSTSIV